jgi:hypothetical protein
MIKDRTRSRDSNKVLNCFRFAFFFSIVQKMVAVIFTFQSCIQLTGKIHLGLIHITETRIRVFFRHHVKNSILFDGRTHNLIIYSYCYIIREINEFTGFTCILLLQFAPLCRSQCKNWCKGRNCIIFSVGFLIEL